MKVLITTLNAKYIHTALAIRLLYVSSYHDFDVSFKEYTIKDQLETIADDILSHQIDVLALSCYIWNVEYYRDLCQILKQKAPHLIIIMGGPEVTYEPAYFIEHFDIDYCMSGEGEETFPQLLHQIENKQPIDVLGVSYRGHISQDVAVASLDYVEALDSPYQLPQDLNTQHQRILYFETSRGCPHQCQYCLSSLEKGLRFFSHDYLVKQLDIVLSSNAKTIKILDRSFNASKKHALFILDYLFKHYKPGQQFQFEINADCMDFEIVDFINQNAPSGLLRFEVGIQSTYEPTNKAVKRMQDFERLSTVIKALMEGGKCDLHLDLIAGLPFETYERFIQSFNDVFAFRAKELQLGFLKLLRGTSLRLQADDYGYLYDPKSPYEMISNHWMNEKDIIQIHIAEDMLEKYWNSGRMITTMNKIMDAVENPFEWFLNLGYFYKQSNYPMISYQLDDLYQCLDEFTEHRYFRYLLKDYFKQFKVRPKKWYASTLSKQQRHDYIERLVERYQFNQDLLYRYAVIEAVDGYLIVAIYKEMQCELYEYEINHL